MRLDELMRLIAVEALYQMTAGFGVRNRVLLARRDFCASRHTVVMNVDQLLDCFKYGIVPVPTDTHIAPANGSAGPGNRLIIPQG